MSKEIYPMHCLGRLYAGEWGYSAENREEADQLAQKNNQEIICLLAYIAHLLEDRLAPLDRANGRHRERMREQQLEFE